MPSMKLKIIYLLLSLSNLDVIFTGPIPRSFLSRFLKFTKNSFYLIWKNSDSNIKLTIKSVFCSFKLIKTRNQVWPGRIKKPNSQHKYVCLTVKLPAIRG